MSNLEKQDIPESFVTEIRAILQNARQTAYTAINSVMVEAYWHIGQRIVEEEQNGRKRADYGSYLLKHLSIKLGAEFGKGFSQANLRNFRQFYLTYADEEIRYTLCSKLSWSHNRLIMRLENPEARQYYLTESIEENWTVRTLQRNIKTNYYERLLSSQEKSLTKTSEQEKQNLNDFIKDPYIFEFLGIEQSNAENESTIEKALIENLKDFLLELGKGFSFVGRQMRISTETSHFFIDLVFYNYILKCFVIFDLKTGKLSHQDIGQMDMYVRMFDDLKRLENDNPTIGVILCTDKDETVVKYSILSDNKNLLATKYRLYLPTEEELIAEIEREKLLLKEIKD